MKEGPHAVKTWGLLHHTSQHASSIGMPGFCLAFRRELSGVASFFVLIRFVDAGDAAPSQKEVSHVLVRLLLRRDVKTMQRHLLHAC